MKIKLLLLFIIITLFTTGYLIYLDKYPSSYQNDLSNYYQKLMIGCRPYLSKISHDSDCCTASVEFMLKGDYFLESEEGCPEGFIRNMLRCPGSLIWCEPEK